jgi:hypothetical protein
MKCPLMLTYDVGEAPCEHPQPMDCLKAECAWWDKEENCCTTKAIDEGLWAIQWELQELRGLYSKGGLL